jgi:hypothetical protein
MSGEGEVPTPPPPPPAADDKPARHRPAKKPVVVKGDDGGPESKRWTVRGNGDSVVLNFAFPVDRPTAKRQFATQYPGLSRDWDHPTFTPGE